MTMNYRRVGFSVVGAVLMCGSLWARALAAVPVYATDFEAGAGSEWSSTTTDNTIPATFTRFLGRYNNNGSTLTLGGLTPGVAHRLLFDFYLLDSWDGGSVPGGDRFQVTVDGTSVFNHTFSQFNGSQSFTTPADQKGQFGFGGWEDSIFRNVEISFTPAAATATVVFQGFNLQDVSDESWGLDNVNVWLASEVPATFVASTSLPAAGSPTAVAIDRFTLAFSRTLTRASATNAANYELRHAGVGGVFGDANDTVYGLTAAYTEGTKTVSFLALPNPLPPGKWRMTAGAGVLDSGGLPIAPFERIFDIVAPEGGAIESTDNGSLEVATPLPMVETPAGRTFYTGYGIGTYATTSEADFWRIDAEAGDRITVEVEATDVTSVYPQLQIRNAANTTLVHVGGGASDGLARAQSFAIPSPGTYYLVTWTDNNLSTYRLRVDQSRGIQLESEGNDSQGSATVLSMSPAGGILEGNLAAALDSGDAAGDFVSLGQLNAGNQVTVSLEVPAGGTLQTNQITVAVQLDGSGTALATSSSGLLTYTAAADGIYHLVFTASNRALRAQYLARVQIADAVPPVVTGVSLPAGGSTSTGLIDRFTVTFSEPLQASTATNAANYSLLESGPDAIFGNGNDNTYVLAANAYAGGLNVDFRVVNGPLQAGNFRFRALGGILDRVGLNLNPEFERLFTMAGIPPFVTENNRNNGIQAGGTPLGPVGAVIGTLWYGGGYGTGGADPYDIASGDFNGDGRQDLVTANFSGDDFSLFLGAGDGTFGPAVRIPSGDGPISLAVGDLNNDGNADVVVGHYYGDTVGVHLGNGDGTFAAVTATAVGNTPRNVRLAQLDGDAIPEILVAAQGQNYLTILKRNGSAYDRTDRTAASNLYGVGSGDFNKDGHQDVITANHGAANVTVFTNNTSGLLVSAGNLAAGSNPRDIAVADFNGDSNPDFAVLNGGSQNVGVYLGNGDGTFAAPVTYPVGSDAYHLVAANLFGDSKPDLAVAVYGGDFVARLTNNGDGTFAPAVNHGNGGNPIGIVAGDWDGDGLTDLAVANYGPNTAGIWLQDRARPLAEDPAGVLTGQGRGALANREDYDFYTFSGQAGDILTLAVETPGSPGASQLYYWIGRPNGTGLTDFYANSYNGWGQSTPVTLPDTGTYSVYVRYNYDYFGEYRIRATLARNGIQAENESGDNDSTGSADYPSLPLVAGKRTATISGYIGVGDGSGDYFGLGSLAPGTSISLALRKPASSPLVGILEIFRGTTLVTNAAPGVTSLAYPVGPGESGQYFARVRASSDAGLMSQYLLDLELVDSAAPTIAQVSLPAEASTSTGMWDAFSVVFSEDMTASTVTNLANYTLTGLGANGVLGGGDDVVYTLAANGYSSGTNTSFRIVNGPLQPGNFRFEIGTGLADIGGQNLAAPYVRTFAVDGVPPFAFENNRLNQQPAGGTPLGGEGALNGGFFLGANPGTGGADPYDVATGDFNGDSIPDLVTANISGDDFSLFLGVGDGTFTGPTRVVSGNGPISIAVGDLDGNGTADVVTALHYAASVAVHLGNGDGTFAAPATFSVGNSPRNVRLAQLDGDTLPEILVANEGQNYLTLLKRNGSSYDRTDRTAASGVHGVASGDFNKDGLVDVVTANVNAANITVFTNGPAGTLTSVGNIGSGSSPRDVAVADFDGDTNPDIAVLNAGGQSVGIYLGNGDGTFDPVVVYSGIGSDAYHLVAADFAGDARPDIAVAVYGGSFITRLVNNGDGTFAAPIQSGNGGNPIGVIAGDWNGDGATDLAAANYGPNNLAVWLADRARPLLQDPTGLLTGQGRGSLFGTGDEDYFTFGAEAGDIVTLAVDTLGNPGASQLYYRIHDPSGGVIHDFYANSYDGWGQSVPVSISTTGTHSVYVRYNYDYRGEYRIRVSLARGGLQMENESGDNNSTGAADVPALTLTAGKQVGSVAGYVGVGDGSGDFYALGNLTEATQITLGLRKPASASALSAVMEIYQGGTKVTNSTAGDAGLIYLVPTGGNGAYYARVLASSGAGLMSQYVLDIELADTIPPVITSVSLPAEGSTSTAIIDRFTVGFSEDMIAASVTNVANYELRSSSNTTFGDGDDSLYTVRPGSYASGLSASFSLPDGPLQPGNYRLTLRSTLTDRGGTQLAEDYVRKFTVAGVGAYVMETRNNDSTLTATPVGGSVGSTSDGSVVFGGYFGAGAQPYDVVLSDLNGDAKLDAVTPNRNGAGVSVLLGNGDGTFAPAVNYPTGNGALAVAVGDIDGDGKLDLAVANYDVASASMLLGNGDGTFGAAVTRSVGSNPRDVETVDLDGDGKAEVVVANSGNNYVSILKFQAGTPPTYSRTDRTAANNVWGVAKADVNVDGKVDVITSNVGGDNVSILLGDGLGDVAAASNFASGTDPRHLAVADFDGDGKPDVITLNSGTSTLSFIKGNGDGTFAAAVSVPGVASDPYHLAAADFDGDGRRDIAVAVYGANDLQIFFNQGTDPFSASVATYQVSGNPIGVAAGDLNGDGLPDLATADYSSNRIAVWLQNKVKPMVESPTGFFTGIVRGNLSSTADTDYYSFSAQAGDVLVVAPEVPGNPGSTGLRYRVDRPDGSTLRDFYASSDGWGSSGPISLTEDGTHYLRVTYNHQYFGEYRVRLTLLRGGYQAETEDNDDRGTANGLTLALDAGQRRASVAGFMDVGDPTVGDYFALGNLTAGVTVNLGLRKPASSPLSGILGLYDSSGALLATGAGPLSHTLASGATGAHYARVLPTFPARAGGTTHAAFFQGGSESIVVPLDVPEDTMTVSFWFYSHNGSAGLFEVSGGGHDRHLYLSGGNIYARLYSSEVINSTGQNFADGLWHHVVYQYGASISGQRIYVDGVLRASGNKASSDFNWQTQVVFGYSSDMGGLVGAIDDVSIWNSAISESAITALMTTPPVGDEAGLIGFWPLNETSGTTAANAKAGAPNGTLVSGASFEPVGSPDARAAGLLTQYVLDVSILDAVPPTVVSNSLPLAGTTSSALVDRFSLVFSEDMLDATVLDPASYELRSAGGNGTFDDGDDQIYSVSCTGYTGGVNAGYLIGDGPLQPGNYRFTANTNLRDRANNPLAANAVRQFVIAAPAGFVMEDRDNGTFATGTSMSTAPTTAFDGSLGALTTIGTGSNPHSMATTDLDGDGNADLVVAVYSADAVQVFLGNGDGTFRTPVNYSTGDGPVDILLADFNGDGELDFVTANYNSGNVSFRPGVGDGTFGTLLNMATGSQANGVAAGDLDKDGKLDLVVGNRNANTVSYLRGNGDGTFAAAVNTAIGAGAGPTRLAVADLNADGNPDVAVANLNNDTLAILHGDGAGALALQPTIAIGDQPYSVRATDLNGDGIVDIAVAVIANHRITVLLGTGGGAFAAPLNLPSGGNEPYHVAVADFDGDGRPDLIASNRSGDNVGILLNAGGGAFRPVFAYPMGNGPLATVMGDWNNDGRPDLATADYDGNTVALRFGNGTQALALDLTGGHGVRAGSGYGNLKDTSDHDYWTFSALAGDSIVLGFDVPGRPSNSGLRYRVIAPSGSTIADTYADNRGWGQTPAVTAPISGTYGVWVTYNWDYRSEYRIRVVLAPTGVTQDNEDNGGTGSANALALVTTGDTTVGNAVGYIRTAGDLDYFDLGTVEAGKTIFLNARLLDYSSLNPVVSVYNASNGYVNEAPGGRAFDAVGEIRIATTGRYFAVVRGGASEAGLREGYVLEVQIVPTSSVAFPNLQVVGLLPPSGGGLVSGGPAEVSFTVKNVGALATGGANWNDRLVISPNATYGDADDIQLAVIPRSGALEPDAEYTVTQTFTLPDGIEGTFRLFAHTDSGNAIPEFVLEGDNVTLADDSFVVTRAQYPDLRPETVAATLGGANVTIEWLTANRGTKAAPAGFKDAVAIRHVASGTIVHRVERTVAAALDVDATLAGSLAAPLPAPGRYAADVTVDSDANVFEFDATSHASAEQNNLASSFFDVFYDLEPVNVRIDPTSGDLASGQAIVVRWEDRATGNRTVSGSWVDRVLIVNRTTGETLLNTTVAHDSAALGAIAPGESHARERAFTLPAVGRGVGTIDVTVTVDSAQQIAEHNAGGDAEANNSALVSRTSVMAPYPDLVVTDLAAPAVGDATQPILVTWKLANVGTAPVSGTWTENLYLASAADGTGRQFIGQATVNTTVTPGTPVERSASFNIPSSAGGNRWVVVETDAGNAVVELNELNNAGIGAAPTLVRRPNLVVKSITLPPEASAGVPITIEWQVENTGDGGTFASRHDAAYVSLASDGSAPVYLGQLQDTNAIPAGETVTRSAQFTLPGGAPGDRYIVLTADVHNAVAESSDADNSRVSSTPVVLRAPDLDVATASAPATALFGGTVAVDFTLANLGNGPATGAWVDRVFISTDNTFGSDVLLVTRPAGDASPLSAGGSTPLSVNVTLPPSGTPGVHYLFVQSDATGVVGEANEGNNVSDPIAITLSNPPRADLVVQDVVVPASVNPGQSFTVQWKTRNAGTVPVSGSWTETVALSEDAAIGGDVLFATVWFSGSIPAAGSVDRSAQITVPSDGLAGALRAVVATDTGGAVLEENELNNGAIGATPVAIPLVLSLSASAASAPESAPSVGFTVTRNGSRTSALTVTVASTDTTEITVPATVEIPAGQASRAFNGTPVNDNTFDGDQTANVNVSATGFLGATVPIGINDVNRPTLTLTLAAATVPEGQTVSATVQRDSSPPTAMEVTISTPSPVQIVVPATVTIPANANQATFLVLAQQDTAIEPDTTYAISVATAGGNGDSKNLKVIDDDLPAVTLTFSKNPISEGGGPNAAVGTVTRSVVSDRPMAIQLDNNNPAAALLPGSVTIPANEASASFPVAAVDDAVVDGTQTATVTPVILVSGSPYANGTPAALEVTDDDGPTLTVTLASHLVAEGLAPATTGTVHRNTLTTDALEVTLASDAPDEATVPSTVTIPSGQASVTFQVDSVADALSDGNQNAQISASAAGFVTGSDVLVVSDVNLPDLVVQSITPPSSGVSEALAQASYRVRNQGLAGSGVGKTFVSRIYLSTDAVVGGDKFLSQYVFPTNLPAGEFFDVTHSFYLPKTTGQYWLVVLTDGDKQIGELLEDNNARVSAPITVGAAYEATVSTPVDIALAGTEVPLSGKATKVGSGDPVPFGQVNIHVTLRGTTRVFSAICNDKGEFTTSFRPLPGEAGIYTVGASHPGVPSAPAQDTFRLLGMRSVPGRPSISVIEGQSASGTVAVENLSDQELHSLAVTVEDNLPNVTFTAAFDDTTLPGTTESTTGTRTITLTANAADASFIGGTAVLHVTTVEGALLDIPVSVSVIDLRPRLVFEPGRLLAGMKQGGRATVELKLRNDGGEATGPLNVQLPPLPWLSATATVIDSLAPGAETAMMLVLTPADDLPLGPYTGTIGFANSGYGAQVPFEFRCIGNSLGDLRVVAVDEYTFYAEGSPKVAGANVAVRDAYDGTLITSALTDAAGVAQFNGLTNGYYRVVVTADKHSTYSEVHFVNPGTVTFVEAFLSRQTVSYNWTVVPTEIEDRTKIVIETTFETFVPMPVVSIEPSYIDLSEHTAPEQQILMTVRNTGLIAAQGAKLHFGTHPWYEIIPLVEDVGLVPAMGEVKVPVIIRNNAPGGALMAERQAALRAGRKLAGSPELAAGGVPCTITAGLDWFLVCGPGNKYYWVPIPILSVQGDCGGGGGIHSAGWGYGGGWGWGGPVGGGGPGGGGSYYSPPHDFEPPENCKECKPEDFSEDDCFEKNFGADISSVANALAGLFSSIPGVSVEGSASIEATAKVCPCCFEGGISLKGSAGGGAKMGATFTIPIAGAPSISKTINLGGGYTAEVEFSLGTIEGGIEFEVGVGGTASLECRGSDYDVCAYANASLKPSLTAKAGVTGMVRGPGGFEQGIEIGASATIGTGFSGNVQKCLKGGVSGDICFDGVTASFEATLDIPGVYEGKIEASAELVAGSCLNGGTPGGGALASRVAPLLEQLGGLESDRRAGLAGGGTTSVSPASNRTYNAKAQADEGVCATVKLRLEQEAVLTRNAFNATLELINNDPGSAIEDVLVLLNITDEAGNAMGDVFAVRPPVLSGIGAVDGSGTVASGSKGSASWILIPTREAAPETSKIYLVGGTLQYFQDGLQVMVPLKAVPITVYPDPLLYVKYFHQRDVFSDDPFTPNIEPAIPYSMAIMVENKGRGVAKNFRITSAQPQIIENEKGLLIDFKILATQLENENLSPSLTINMGNIDPATNKIGRWLMSSTLQGLFIDYTVTFEHLDAIAGKKTALIDGVTIHEMNRIVSAPAPFDDGRPDFLVNDEPDPPTDFPDRVYLSNGSTQAVQVVTLALVNGVPTPSTPEVTVTGVFNPGFVYLRIPEPSDGRMKLAQVRQGARVIPLDTNVWTTDRTFVGEGKKPVNENVLHLFDYNAAATPGAVAYTLLYGEPPALDTVAPSSAVAALPANSPVNIPVSWSGTDNAGGSGLAAYDVYVSIDGGLPALWLTGTRVTGGIYTGTVGRRYAFYTRAVDSAGNREAAPATPDTETVVGFASSAPTIASIANQATLEDVPVTGVTVVVNDPDTPLATLAVSATSDNLTLLPNEAIGISPVPGQPGQRVLTLSPGLNRSGPAVVTVTVSDGSASASTTFTLTVTAVNDPPVAVADAVSGLPGKGLKIPVGELLANDTDPEFDPITMTAVSGTSTNGGTVRLQGGWVFYTPRSGAGSESDRFTVTVSDGRGGTADGFVHVHMSGEGGRQSRNVLQITAESGGRVKIRFIGIPGRMYSVQASPGLNAPTWVTIGTVTADAAGLMEFIDETPPPGARYYRTVGN